MLGMNGLHSLTVGALVLNVLEGSLEQLLLFAPGASAHGADVEQRNEDCPKGEKEAKRPIKEKAQTLKPGLQQRLAPDQHPGGNREAKQPQPTAPCVCRIHAPPYALRRAFPSGKSYGKVPLSRPGTPGRGGRQTCRACTGLRQLTLSNAFRPTALQSSFPMLPPRCMNGSIITHKRRRKKRGAKEYACTCDK
jgi:hypothetical protein